MGNVVMLMDGSNKRILARYDYDMWGNCTVYNQSNEVDTDNGSIGHLNPIRWKGFYYDTESGLYYANGSYYDPETGLYLDATPISTAIDNAHNTRCLDRNGLLCNNVLELASNPFTIATVTDLSVDPNYDYDDVPWYVTVKRWINKALSSAISWYHNLHWSIKLVTGTLLLCLAILITIASDGTGAEAAMLLVDIALGVATGVGMWAAGTFLSGDKFTMKGFAEAALDSFLLCAAIAFVSASVSAIKYAARSSPNPQAALDDCAGNGVCFIAGTLVLCEDGYKKIEDIQVGDKVLAYDEQTGEQGYKKVVQLFRNESTDWIGLTINGKEIDLHGDINIIYPKPSNGYPLSTCKLEIQYYKAITSKLS